MRAQIDERIAKIERFKIPDGYEKNIISAMPQDWHVKRLGDLFTRVTRKNTVGNDNVLTISAQYGLINQEDFFNKSVASENISDYYLLKRGEFAYNKSYSKGYPYGAIKQLTEYDSGVVSPLYICFALTDSESCPEYYVHYFEAGLMNSEIKAFAQEGARNHGLLNIAVDDLFRSAILVPPLPEQRKIAAILSTQDKFIELKSSLLDEKLRQKKYLAQILLSGKKRLKGFHDKWEISPLGKLFTERTETNCEFLQLLAITASRGVVPRDMLDLKDNSSDDKTNYLKICVGDIGYNTMRMWQGVSAYSHYEGIVSPAYTILVPKPNVDGKYFAYLFKLPRIIFLFYRFSQGLVDDTRNLKYDNFRKISVYYPSNIKEQHAISDILSTADREIELLRQELELEKQKKKALMQLLLTGKVRVKTDE